MGVGVGRFVNSQLIIFEIENELKGATGRVAPEPPLARDQNFGNFVSDVFAVVLGKGSTESDASI